MYLNVNTVIRPEVILPDEDIWIPKNQTVTVAGREIAGMIYLGNRKHFRRTQETYADPVIDPDLEVEDAPSGRSLSYQYRLSSMRYYTLHSYNRARYLDWLASDRAVYDCHESMIRFYLYGLERRFFLDSPPLEEQHAIIKEVERLLTRYNYMFGFQQARRELSYFLYTAHAMVQPPDKIEPRFKIIGGNMSLDVRVAIGHMIEAGQPLSSDWALSWYATHPDTQPLRATARWAFPEFRALFAQLFEKVFPKGVTVSPPQVPLQADYRAASLSFDASISPFKEIPDIPPRFNPPQQIGELVHEATEALNKYGRFLRKHSEGWEKIEAYTLLPQSIRPLFENTAVKELQSWAGTVIDSGNLPLIEQIVEKVDEAPPEKITKGHTIRAANTLAILSIGMVPDPRLDLRGPKMGESVVLFKLPEPVTELKEVSSRYHEALLCLMIGAFIAHADDLVGKEEHAALETYLHSVPVTEPERDRLLANLQWALSVPPNLAGFRRHLKNVAGDLPLKMGKFALCIAAVDGKIETAEIKALEKLYKVLDLAPESIYSELHALSLSGGPKTIPFANGSQNSGFAAASPDDQHPVILDEGQIASLKMETAQVSALLGNIFEETVQEEVSTGSNGSTDVFDGLDAGHSAFLRELLTRRHWDKSEYAVLAGRFQLMHEGTLETLNEWSFDRFEDILIDEGAHYDINPEISAKLCQ